MGHVYYTMAGNIAECKDAKCFINGGEYQIGHDERDITNTYYAEPAETPLDFEALFREAAGLLRLIGVGASSSARANQWLARPEVRQALEETK